MTLLQRLAGLLARPVEAPVRARAALHVLDWVGCAALGRRSEAGGMLAGVAEAYGPGPALGLGAGRLSVPGAILVNGGLGNVLEMDDTHRACSAHPGPVVIPAALAAAEAVGADGPALLDAVVRGYEAMIRVGEAQGAAHGRMFHTTATAGPFGAAAAVASLLRLGPRATVDALANAGTQAGGLWQCRHSATMTKQLHTARAAHDGWVAARLAAEGFAGPADLLEGAQGYFAALCPGAAPGLVAEGDPAWRMWEVSFKPYPACRHVHAVIDAALALRARGAGTPEAVVVTSYAAALAFCDNPRPRTPHEARFSLQHACAITLLDGTPWLDAFEPAAIDRPDVAGLRERVQVRLAPGWGEAHPARFRAHVAVTGPGGTDVADVHDALGDPANPLGAAGVEGKAVALMRAAGLAAPGPVVAACLALPAQGTASDLTRALEAWSTQVRAG